MAYCRPSAWTTIPPFTPPSPPPREIFTETTPLATGKHAINNSSEKTKSIWNSFFSCCGNNNQQEEIKLTVRS